MSYRNPSGGLGNIFNRNRSPFHEVYVQEVLIDPSTYEFPEDDATENPEGFLLLGNTLQESDVINAPYNSIIGRIVSGDEHNTEIIVYPMFPSHMSLPIKAGEHVWAMFNNGRYYWLCRKNFDQQINDANLAWAGRYKLQNSFLPTSEAATAAESSTSQNILPTNRNPKINTLFPHLDEDLDNKDKKIKMEDFWSERSKNLIEPVPRYKKRPGDLVLQGSNNTLICLGIGGGHRKEDKMQADTKPISLRELDEELENFNIGTIDMVTGRGRYGAKPTTATSLGDLPERTAAATIMSEFDYKEVDKNPQTNEPDKAKNLTEGDPDFGFDASRIYISSHTNIDEDFSLINNFTKIPPLKAIQTDPTSGRVIKAALSTNEDDFELQESFMSSAISLKSDQLRLIARYHLASEHFNKGLARDVNGNIRIIKEGLRDEDGHSVTTGAGVGFVCLESDGTVFIDGNAIILGTGREEENGAGNQIFLGRGATEPIVLGNQMKQLLTDFFTELQNWLATKFDTHIHPTGTGPSGPPTVTGNDAGTGAAKETINKTLSKVGMTK